MKKGDLILLVLAAVGTIGVIAGFLWFKKPAIDCVVYEKNEEIGRYPLNTDTTVRIETSDGHYNILKIENGEASVCESDCANQICVNTKAANKAGDTIICLPHKVSVILEGRR